MDIRFLGGSETVTGSCHYITTKDNKILLDCGQFQGGRVIDDLNYLDFGFDPSEIDFLFLSHAHIDHSGRIPLLVKKGFRGKIFCTEPTYDLVNIMLQDSGFIHEKEAEWENKKRIRAGEKTVEPLYTYEDAVKAMVYFEPALYDQMIIINDKIKVRFNDAGHILGSSIIELWITEDNKTSKIVYSGDLGMKDKPILRNPAIIREADFLIMETTYGDRLHEEKGSRIDILMDIILKTTKRGGNVVIPSFAVGRTQEILFELNKYYEYHTELRDVLSKIPVYVDSPLAISATEIFENNAQVFDEETRDYILNGDNPLDFENLHFTRSAEESMALNIDKTPKIIISASGMADAGRIKHHLKHNLWNEACSIVFVGYQAEGTLGRRITDGQKEVKIFGEIIQVKAEIYSIEGFSGHADQSELIEWLSHFDKKPSAIFLVHGEAEARKAFADRVKNELHYDCILVHPDEVYELHKAVEVHYIDKDSKVSFDDLMKLSDRIYTLKSQMEHILYQTRLSVGTEMDADKYEAINNRIIELEKDIISLAVIIGER